VDLREIEFRSPLREQLQWETHSPYVSKRSSASISVEPRAQSHALRIEEVLRLHLRKADELKTMLPASRRSFASISPWSRKLKAMDHVHAPRR
jgi:hypothetical protein